MKTSNNTTTPHVAILLGTFNGESYLGAQLESFLKQTHGNWSLWVSDDGSTDFTLKILNDFQNDHPEHIIKINKGPMEGFSRNYLSLLGSVDPEADFFAFSDQDDIWLPEKLAHAIKTLQRSDPKTPTLFASRTLIIDSNGRSLGLSKKKNRIPSLPNALIQNIASGNTMVFNRSALDLLKAGGPELDVYAHDWWAYLAITAVQGDVYFDNSPSLLYRQHQGNQIGASIKLRSYLNRVLLDLNGNLRNTISQNLRALKHIESQIPQRQSDLIHQIEKLRQKNPFFRIYSFMKLPLKRQTFLENISLFLAVLLGRI